MEKNAIRNYKLQKQLKTLFKIPQESGSLKTKLFSAFISVDVDDAENLLLERLIYRMLSDDKNECKNKQDLCGHTDEVKYDRNPI